MNSKLSVFSVLLLFLYFSCNQKGEKKNNPHNATINTEQIAKVPNAEREKTFDERMESSLHKALTFVRENYDQERNVLNITLEKDTTTFDVETVVEMGDLFEDGANYVLIRRKFIDKGFVNLYTKNEKKLEPLIVYEKPHFIYTGDTIVDVNGDGRKDYVLQLYPNSGCCLANIDLVYINDNGDFSKQYEFLNPTYFPKEKLIRGLGYAHPGETELYTYKWNNFVIDTLEYIYPSIEKKGLYLKTTRKLVNTKEEDIITIKNVPKAYRSIKYYHWFLGESNPEPHL